jgi:hypothetical protein
MMKPTAQPGVSRSARDADDEYASSVIWNLLALGQRSRQPLWRMPGLSGDAGLAGRYQATETHGAILPTGQAHRHHP